MLTEAEMEQYRTQGYFITDNAVEPNMLPPLLESAKRVKAKIQSNEIDIFTHRSEDGEPWAIRGLFAPEFDEPIFAEYLMSEPIMGYTHAFLSGELRLGGVLIFTNPYEADYGFGWHRDFGKNERDGTEAVELEILNRPMTRIKWHLALIDDACLMVVPGSQKRYRTDHERDCLLNTRHEDIPGQKVIALKAGQTAFWSGNIIHRGIMKKDGERLTVAGSWAKHSADDPPEETDKRLKWMLAENVRGALPEAMQPYYDRWRALQKG